MRRTSFKLFTRILGKSKEKQIIPSHLTYLLTALLLRTYLGSGLPGRLGLGGHRPLQLDRQPHILAATGEREGENEEMRKEGLIMHQHASPRRPSCSRWRPGLIMPIRTTNSHEEISGLRLRAKALI